MGEFVDDGSTGIAQVEHFGDFIEAFAGCIVARAAQELVVSPLRANIQIGVPSGNHQGDKRIGHIVMLKINRADMPFEMMDRHERLVRPIGQGFGEREPNQ